jgi:hypothetical protein
MNSTTERGEILADLERYLFEGHYVGLKEEPLIKLALELETVEKAESDEGLLLYGTERESIILQWRERERLARSKYDYQFFADVATVLGKLKKHRDSTRLSAAAKENTIRDICGWIAYRIIYCAKSDEPLPTWSLIRSATEQYLARLKATEVVGRSYYESPVIADLCREQSLTIEEQAKRYNEEFEHEVRKELKEFKIKARPQNREIPWRRIRGALGLKKLLTS